MTATALAPWPRGGTLAPRAISRPRLRIAEPVDSRTLRRRLKVGALALVAVVAVFAMVAFHALVAQSQVTLDRLEQRTATAERRYEQARFEHAKLSAPQRIVDRASALGLEAPASPPTAVAVAGPVPDSPRGTSTTLRGWTEVKPALDDGS